MIEERLDLIPWIMIYFVRRHKVRSTNTQFLYNCTTQVQMYRTERFTTALEVEPQGYRHILNTIIRWQVTFDTTLLQWKTLIPKLVKAR